MADYDDNWSFIEQSMMRRQGEQNARSMGRLEEINREKSSIRGPEHPRLASGISNVRNFAIGDFKPFDFMAEGLLNVGEDLAYGDQSETSEYAMAGLEAAGGAAGKAVGRLSKALMSRKVAPEIAPTDRFTDNVVDMYDDDSVLDSIREMFGPGSIAEQKMAREPSVFSSNMSPDMTRKSWQATMDDLKIDPTNIQLQDELGGYGRMLKDQKMDVPGVSAFDENGGRLATEELSISDADWENFESYVSTR